MLGKARGVLGPLGIGLVVIVAVLAALLIMGSRAGDDSQGADSSAAAVRESPQPPPSAAEDRQSGSGESTLGRSTSGATARAAEEASADRLAKDADGARQAQQDDEQTGAAGRHLPGGTKEAASAAAPNPNTANPGTSAGPVHTPPPAVAEPDGGVDGGDAPGGREDGDVTGTNGAATGGRQD